MAESIVVTGLQDVQKNLYSFSQQLGDKVVYAALRQGANLVKRQAIANLDAGIKGHSTGKLRKGIAAMKSKINRGRFSGDLLGMTLTIRHSRKKDPYYGRFQEEGWNTHGPRGVRRSVITSIFGTRTGRKTGPGKTDVDGKQFIAKAWDAKRESAVELITRTAEAGADLLAKKLGL